MMQSHLPKQFNWVSLMTKHKEPKTKPKKYKNTPLDDAWRIMQYADDSLDINKEEPINLSALFYATWQIKEAVKKIIEHLGKQK